eukprot:297126_1
MSIEKDTLDVWPEQLQDSNDNNDQDSTSYTWKSKIMLCDNKYILCDKLEENTIARLKMEKELILQQIKTIDTNLYHDTPIVPDNYNYNSYPLAQLPHMIMKQNSGNNSLYQEEENTDEYLQKYHNTITSSTNNDETIMDMKVQTDNSKDEKEEKWHLQSSSWNTEAIESMSHNSTFSYDGTKFGTECEEMDRFTSESVRTDSDNAMVSQLSDDQLCRNIVTVVDRNVIVNACDSLTKIQNSLELWESSVKTIQSEPTENIVSFGRKKDRSTQTLPTNGDEQDNSEKNKETNNNENNDKNNQNQNNDENKLDEHKNNDDCNVKWHAPTIMSLQNKVQIQTQQIKTLNGQLCKQMNWNTLMRIDLALNMYYKRHGIDSFFIKGNGKLSQFVIDNDLNDGSYLLSNTLSDE